MGLVLSPSDLKDHGVQQWYKLSEQPALASAAVWPWGVRGLGGLCADDLPGALRAGGPGGHDRQADPQRREGAEGAWEPSKCGGGAKDRLYVVVFVPEKTEQCKQRLAGNNVGRSGVATEVC